MSRIGVVALQGGFGAHARALRDLGHDAVEVRAEADLDLLEGLIFPGGESTAQLRLIDRHGLGRALQQLAASGRPILATCAGLILAARHVISPEQRSFGWIDATVARNAWGRQVDSFETFSDELPFSALSNEPASARSIGGRVNGRWVEGRAVDLDVLSPAANGDSSPASEGAWRLPLVFIRAPRIVRVGAKVEVLATLGGEPILIRQGNITGATFHPELTPDRRVHRAAFGDSSHASEDGYEKAITAH